MQARHRLGRAGALTRAARPACVVHARRCPCPPLKPCRTPPTLLASCTRATAHTVRQPRACPLIPCGPHAPRPATRAPVGTLSRVARPACVVHVRRRPSPPLEPYRAPPATRRRCCTTGDSCARSVVWCGVGFNQTRFIFLNSSLSQLD